MFEIPWKRSVRLNYPAGPDTGGANTSSFMGSIDDGPDSLKIGVPSPLGDVMSMAHVVAKQGTFSANITACCHDDLLKDFLKTPNYSKFLALGSKPKIKGHRRDAEARRAALLPVILRVLVPRIFALFGRNAKTRADSRN